LPLYRGQIHTEPAGWTLVNLPTRLWCADPAGRPCARVGGRPHTVVLLGRPVRIRPRVVGFAWRFGDGTTAAVPAGVAGDGRVRHVYRARAAVTVTVTLTWAADYAVAGGAFRPIPGATTTTSPPLTLPVRQARPVLVGG
jgi:hypothetical protein